MKKKKLLAHKISPQIWRSNDINLGDNYFSDFNLNPNLIKGLNECGFFKPSEIQLKSIPYGRLGIDLFVQSKSGTGKTCVFAIIVLDSIDINNNYCQSLILASTREIAIQIEEVLKLISRFMKNLKIKNFIGGTELHKNISSVKNCHIAIGTPGRIKHLIEENHLKTHHIRTFILDEADKFFDDFNSQITDINNQLPCSKQTIILTATPTTKLFDYIEKNMKNPYHVKINYEQISLVGLDQFYLNFNYCPSEILEKKQFKNLIYILSNVTFNQCLIFSNSESRTNYLKENLNNFGWKTHSINGKLDQKMRNKIIKDIKDYKFKILISSDLLSRGIDCENINLVINLEVPLDLETYLHRIGRCGRFGQHGIAITLCYGFNSINQFKLIREKLNVDIYELQNLNQIDDLWKFKQKQQNKEPLSLENLTDEQTIKSDKYFSFNELIKDYENFLN